MVIFFVCLLPVRHLLSSMAVLYHVSGRIYLWLSAGLVSWDLTGAGHSEIAVELEVSCLTPDWHADFDG